MFYEPIDIMHSQHLGVCAAHAWKQSIELVFFFLIGGKDNTLL
jgi:hypothetical protein